MLALARYLTTTDPVASHNKFCIYTMDHVYYRVEPINNSGHQLDMTAADRTAGCAVMTGTLAGKFVFSISIRNFSVAKFLFLLFLHTEQGKYMHVVVRHSKN